MLAKTALLVLAILCFIFFAVFAVDLFRGRKKAIKYHKSEVITSYALLIPAVALAFFFVVLPIAISLRYAFTDFNLYYPQEENTHNVGFDNFKWLFAQFGKHGDLYYAARNTLIFVVLVVPIQIGLALLLALFCNNKRRGTTVFKVCFFAPVAVSLAVTSYLWLEILSANETGFMNSILKLFGISAHDFLREEGTVLIWMVIISAWQGCGYQMLIFLSALGNIRKDLYEAASIDGAGPFRRFKTVTLPGLKPTLLYIIITVTIGACRVMIQPLLLTKGVHPRSMTLSLLVYDYGYTSKDVGLSCALAFMMTIVMGTITLVQRKLLGDKNS